MSFPGARTYYRNITTYPPAPVVTNHTDRSAYGLSPLTIPMSPGPFVDTHKILQQHSEMTARLRLKTEEHQAATKNLSLLRSDSERQTKALALKDLEIQKLKKCYQQQQQRVVDVSRLLNSTQMKFQQLLDQGRLNTSQLERNIKAISSELENKRLECEAMVATQRGLQLAHEKVQEKLLKENLLLKKEREEESEKIAQTPTRKKRRTTPHRACKLVTTHNTK